jgi:hypothetical protein
MAPVVIPTITVAVGGIPITIDPTITLSAAAVASVEMPEFRLQFGASAKVALKLGGKVTFKELPSSGAPDLTIAAYSKFDATFSQVPFKLSGFTSAAGSIDATIVPVMQVKVWKILPFTMQPNFNMKHSLAVGTSRQLVLRGEEHGRALATCTTGQVSSTAGAAGSLGVTLDKVMAFSMVKSFTGVDFVAKVGSSFDFAVIPVTKILDATKTSFSVSGAVAAAATACVATGSSISTGGTTSAGGGAAGAAGSGGAGGAGGAGGDSACGPGCIAGAVIGSILGATLLFIAAVHVMYVSGKAPVPPFLQPLVSCIGGGRTVAPVITSAPSAAAAAAAKMPAAPAASAPAQTKAPAA